MTNQSAASGHVTQPRLPLARVVLASQFYLLASLPSSDARDFCGLSPGSLAYGAKGRDYQVLVPR